MITFTFTVPGWATKGSTRAIAPGVIRHDSTKLKPWTEHAQWAAKMALRRAAPWVPYDHLVIGRVDLVVTFAMDNLNRADVDKLLRATLDALTGIIYHDDKQVIHVEATKTIAAPLDADATTITVTCGNSFSLVQPTARQSKRAHAQVDQALARRGHARRQTRRV